MATKWEPDNKGGVKSKENNTRKRKQVNKALLNIEIEGRNGTVTTRKARKDNKFARIAVWTPRRILLSGIPTLPRKTCRVVGSENGVVMSRKDPGESGVREGPYVVSREEDIFSGDEFFGSGRTLVFR